MQRSYLSHQHLGLTLPRAQQELVPVLVMQIDAVREEQRVQLLMVLDLVHVIQVATRGAIAARMLSAFQVSLK